jgi:O-methyltransferase involved in polyketide biosynthesis
VILGAGLDSFAYRRTDVANVLRVFEVDHPATQAWKQSRLRELNVAHHPISSSCRWTLRRCR